MWKLVSCPSCKATNNPLLGEPRAAEPMARPPIPERRIITCRNCGGIFYVVESTQG